MAAQDQHATGGLCNPGLSPPWPPLPAGGAGACGGRRRRSLGPAPRGRGLTPVRRERLVSAAGVMEFLGDLWTSTLEPPPKGRCRRHRGRRPSFVCNPSANGDPMRRGRRTFAPSPERPLGGAVMTTAPAAMPPPLGRGGYSIARRALASTASRGISRMVELALARTLPAASRSRPSAKQVVRPRRSIQPSAVTRPGRAGAK